MRLFKHSLKHKESGVIKFAPINGEAVLETFSPSWGEMDQYEIVTEEVTAKIDYETKKKKIHETILAELVDIVDAVVTSLPPGNEKLDKVKASLEELKQANPIPEKPEKLNG